MRRREFITLVSGAAVAWPLAARAQQGERMRRMGVLTGVGEGDLDTQARHAALLQGLAQLGWADGHNLQIDFRWGGGDAERIAKSAIELAALAPDVIFATGSASTPHGTEFFEKVSNPRIEKPFTLAELAAVVAAVVGEDD